MQHVCFTQHTHTQTASTSQAFQYTILQFITGGKENRGQTSWKCYRVIKCKMKLASSSVLLGDETPSGANKPHLNFFMYLINWPTQGKSFTAHNGYNRYSYSQGNERGVGKLHSNKCSSFMNHKLQNLMSFVPTLCKRLTQSDVEL